MTVSDVLQDAFTRNRELLPQLLQGLRADQLLWQPDPQANSIGWLAWHLARVEDDHLAGIAGAEQVWTARGFAQRFTLPYAVDDIGYGHTADQVAGFSMGDADLLAEYYAAVHRNTLAVVGGLVDDDLQRVVDERWDPPVTAGVRLVSVINDTFQHMGQIGYLRGLVERRSRL